MFVRSPRESFMASRGFVEWVIVVVVVVRSADRFLWLGSVRSTHAPLFCVFAD